MECDVITSVDQIESKERQICMGPGMTSSSRDTGDGEKQNVTEWLNVLFVTWAAPADIGVDLSLFDDDCTLLLT